MPSEPRWVTADELIEINRRAVEATGEPFGVLMPDQLESAAARPFTYWYYEEEIDVAALAVRLLIGIARAQAFQQGNKRTGFYGAVLFLVNNGYYLDVEDEEDVADFIIEVIIGHRDEQELIEEFRDRLIEAA